MKPIIGKQSGTRWKTMARSLAFGGLLALATAPAFADRGRGSVRAEGREAGPAPQARTEARPQPEARGNDHEAGRPAPQARGDAHEAGRSAPEARRDVHEAARPEPARRDWDAGDEDNRHSGGFAAPVPQRARIGARIRALPERHSDVVWNNRHYYLDDAGVYYLAQPDGEYLAVQPPAGIAPGALPDGATPITLGPTTYYYLDGVFYVAQANGYVVVTPPAGILVPALPSGATQAVVNGAVVYQFDGFNYTPTLYGGVTAYVVTPA